jgi:superfamily II DNA/RNA helicase
MVLYQQGLLFGDDQPDRRNREWRPAHSKNSSQGEGPVQGEFTFQFEELPQDKRPELYEGELGCIDEKPSFNLKGPSFEPSYVPCASLEEFSKKFDAPLRISQRYGEAGLKLVKPQLEAAEYLAITRNDTMVEAPTGSGKTAIGTMAIGAALGADKKILVVAPTKILCDQWKDRLDAFLDLSRASFSCEVKALSGDKVTISAAKRLAEINAPGSKILIVTPEALEIDLKKVSADDFRNNFNLVIFDEADEARASDAMNLTSLAIRNMKVRQVLFSAAFEDSAKAVELMARERHATYLPVKVAPQLFVKERTTKTLDQFATPARSDCLVTAKMILMDGFSREAHKIISALPDGHLKTEISEIRDEYVKDNRWPSHETWSEIAEKVRVQCLSADNGKLTPARAAAIKSAYKILHIQHLHEALVTCGASQYMHFVAQNIMGVRMEIDQFRGPKRNGAIPKYMRELYCHPSFGSSSVLKAFELLARGGNSGGESGPDDKQSAPSKYLGWLKARSLIDVINSNFQGQRRVDAISKAGVPNSGLVVGEELLVDASEDLARRCGAWSNHPKEEAMIKALSDYFIHRGPEGRALVYTFYAEHAFYLERALNHALKDMGIKTAAITGSGNQKVNERSEKLTSFRSGEARVLVFTEVAKKGMDTPAEQMFIYNPPGKGRDMIQLVGRIRNHEQGIPVYTNPETLVRVPQAKVHFFIAEDTVEKFKYIKATKGFKSIKERITDRIDNFDPGF